MITQSELHRIFDYNPNTGIFRWKINVYSGKNYKTCKVKKGDVAGSINGCGYVQIKINKTTYKAHRLAWFYVYGKWPKKEIDHKNQIKYCNSINNLREVSDRCQMRNCGNRGTNTSGIKGVGWDKQHQKWRVIITVNYKTSFLGRYNDFDEAVCARLAGEQCVDWEKDEKNSPAFQYVQRMLKNG